MTKIRENTLICLSTFLAGKLGLVLNTHNCENFLRLLDAYNFIHEIRELDELFWSASSSQHHVGFNRYLSEKVDDIADV